MGDDTVTDPLAAKTYKHLACPDVCISATGYGHGRTADNLPATRHGEHSHGEIPKGTKRLDLIVRYMSKTTACRFKPLLPHRKGSGLLARLWLAVALAPAALPRVQESGFPGLFKEGAVTR